MTALLPFLTTVMPLLPAFVASVGGLYALWAMRHEPIGSRKDLRQGIGLAGLVAFGLGAFAGLMIYSLSGMFSSGPRPEALGPAAAYGAIVAGVVGAKIRFMAVHRHEGRFEGWSIQGFLAAIAIVAPIALAIANVPIGVLLDASALGLFLGLAIGRIGCFFAGCCAGRPTSAAWGVWSSDQRLGMRRIPTQLLESGLAVGIALMSLVAVLGYRPLLGGSFVAALALYTLVRQGILRLRVEHPTSVRGGALIAATSAVVLIADVALLALGS